MSFTNSFMQSSDNKNYYEKSLKAVIQFTENIFCNRFGKNVLNKQLW